MMAILWDLISPFAGYIAGGIALVLAWWGKGKLGERKGRKDERDKRAAADAKEHKETVERVLDEATSADPADDIRKRMRERAGK